MIDRDPLTVVAQIIAVVPDEHKAEFESLRYSFQYKAPEQRRECFSHLARVCNCLVAGGLQEDWQRKVVAILTAQEM